MGDPTPKLTAEKAAIECADDFGVPVCRMAEIIKLARDETWDTARRLRRSFTLAGVPSPDRLKALEDAAQVADRGPGGYAARDIAGSIRALAREQPEKNAAAVELGRLGGKKGGPAKAAKLTSEERSTAARKAAQARWAKRSRQDI